MAIEVIRRGHLPENDQFDGPLQPLQVRLAIFSARMAVTAATSATVIAFMIDCPVCNHSVYVNRC